jgi:hypothetical protein
MLTHKRSRTVNVVLYGSILAVISLSLWSLIQAQSVTISGPVSTTQILENLYSGSDKTALVTPTGSVTVPAGTGIYALSTGWTVENEGTVSGKTGMLLNLGGSVVNSHQITGTGGNNEYGIYLGNGADAVNTVTNTGTIAGTGSGTIGIRALNVTPFTLNNSGFVYGGTNARAVLVAGQGNINNQTGGQIIGGNGTSGIAIQAASATVQNDGTITGNGVNGYGIYTDTTGNITNTSHGVITGGGGTGGSGIGIYLATGGTVDNSGTIKGNKAQGIYMGGAGKVTNRTDGRIGDTNQNGTTIGVNLVTIGSSGIGEIANETGATIEGYNNGVVISGSGKVVNYGTITGSTAYGIRFNNKIGNTTFAGTYTTEVENHGAVFGSVAGLGINFSNPATGGVTNVTLNKITNTLTGSISANGGSGIRIQDTPTTAISSMTNEIENLGIISGSAGNSGILIQGLGTFTNKITNSGIITGGAYGAQINSGSITNSGIITGGTGIKFTGGGDDTLTNRGIISGSGGTAVDMGEGNDTVTLATGSAISGTINGGNGKDSMTLTGNGLIGAGQITNFETLIKDGAGAWTLTGTGSIGGDININEGTLIANGDIVMNNGGMLNNFSGGTLNGAGSITGDVINASGANVKPGNSPGTLTINGNFSSSGNLEFEIGGLGLGQYDVLDINGMAKFTGGIIEFDFINGFKALANNYWDFLLADSIAGWDSLAFNFQGLDPGLGFEFVHLGTGERLLITQNDETAVPEPTTMLLLGLGLMGLAGVRRMFEI